jgi:hypothetical protein
MLLLLPLACLALLIFFGFRGAPESRDRREDLLNGLVIWGICVALIAESTSALMHYDRWTVAVGWAVAMATILFVRRGRALTRFSRVAGLSASQRVLAGGVLMILLLIGLTAVAAPPNTWDALTYHMPRVAHWIQNRTVAHYPTSIVRQLYLPPWSEFAVSQLQLLSGSDRFANCVQWLALAASAVAVSRIAGQLGAGSTGQVLSGVFAVTLPMAILQGSSAQTDLVTSLWVLIFVSEVLASRTESWSPVRMAIIGGAIGLALLTKPTAGIFAAPFVIGLVFTGFRRFRFQAARPLLISGSVALALLLPHAARNSRLFGSPLGISRGVVNEVLGPCALASNFARNVALEATTPFPSVNRAIEKMVVGVHRAISCDVNDPATTWLGSEFHVPPAPLGGRPLESDESLYSLFHEDTASNPVHALLFLAAAAILLAKPALRARKDLLWVAGSLALSFLLFCAALKWQPWHSRLHLPLFLIAAALAGVVWTSVLPPRATEWLGLLLLAAALPWVCAGATRPLLGSQSVLATSRASQYFSIRPLLEQPYEAAARSLAEEGCSQIGLAIGPDTPEYLLWVLFQPRIPSGLRIEHVDVANVSRTRESAFPAFFPCARVSVETRPDGQTVRFQRVASR